MLTDKKILVAGGSGFVGRALVAELLNKGCRVWVLGRNASVIKRFYGEQVTAITWASLPQQTIVFDGIINLAGQSIAAGRWTPRQKQQLLASRIETTQALVDYCLQASCAPSVFINASAVGFYGNQGDTLLTDDAAGGSGFAHDLCYQWEQTLKPLSALPIRVCIARLGVVLAVSGGGYGQMALPFKCKVALQNGHGQQWLAWVALQDAVAAFVWLLEQPKATGVYNLCAPSPVTNAMFTQHLAAHYGTWVRGAIPAGVLRLLLGEMADELILASQRVLPSRLLSGGFNFSQPQLTDFLRRLA